MATRKIINGIVYEEHGDSLFYPAFADCQQTELTLCGHQAVELMEEIDPSTLDIINISGLGKTIWTEISNSVEQRWLFRQTVGAVKKINTQARATILWKLGLVDAAKKEA